MNRVGTARATLRVFKDAAVAVRTPFEVSLDCHACQRRHRTVVFGAIGAPGMCTPTGHPFPGNLLTLDAAEASLSARFLFEYLPFIDAKYPNGERYRDFEPGAPSWVRFAFAVACASCGSHRLESTQTNIVRPWTSVCDCGAALYEDFVAPTLTWEPR